MKVNKGLLSLRSVTARSTFVVLAAATLLSPRSVHAADVCIDEKAKQDLNACAVAGREFDVGKHGKAPQVNFHSAPPPPQDLKKRDQQKKPNAPSMEQNSADRDDRKSRLQARQRGLLVTEIQSIETLFKDVRGQSQRVRQAIVPHSRVALPSRT